MRMKVLSIVSLFLTSFASNAMAMTWDGLKNNFLFGAELGVESHHSRFEMDYARVTTPTVAQQIQHRIVDTGSFLGLLGGWQAQYERFLFGVEANVDFSSFEESKGFYFTDNGGAFTGTVKNERDDIWGISVRGGYWVTPFFMPYIRLGAQFSRDEVTFVVPTLLEKESYKKDMWGCVTGVGMEFPAFGPSSVRVEFNYIFTEHFDATDTTGLMRGNINVTHGQSYLGKIAWVWNFM